jgi:hypothetical protein
MNALAPTSMAADRDIGELGQMLAWGPILCSGQKSSSLSGMSSNNYRPVQGLQCASDEGTCPEPSAGSQL